MLKRKNSQKIDEVVARSVSFETTIAEEARRSTRRAWAVASCSCIVSLCLIGGYFYMLPLKEKVPYIVLADPYSGTSSLARLTDDLVNRQVTASEAINRSNIAHFVLAREAYDLALTNMRDWPTVMTMAAPNVAAPYRQLYAPSNPSSPYKLYGANKAIRVKILSIVLEGSGVGVTPKGATVRFQRVVYDKSNGGTTPLDSKIATMAFVYKPNLRMNDQSRIENPLGFQVTSYRVDNDYGTTVPVEILQTAPQATTPGAAAATQDATAGMDPDDMQTAQPAQNAGAIPMAQETLQNGAVPPAPLPPSGAYPAGTVPPGSAPATATPAQQPAAATRQPAPSAAIGGHR